MTSILFYSEVMPRPVKHSYRSDSVGEAVRSPTQLLDNGQHLVIKALDLLFGPAAIQSNLGPERRHRDTAAELVLS